MTFTSKKKIPGGMFPRNMIEAYVRPGSAHSKRVQSLRSSFRVSPASFPQNSHTALLTRISTKSP